MVRYYGWISEPFTVSWVLCKHSGLAVLEVKSDSQTTGILEGVKQKWKQIKIDHFKYRIFQKNDVHVDIFDSLKYFAITVIPYHIATNEVSIEYELNRKPDDCSLHSYMLIFLSCRHITPQSSIGKWLRALVLEAWVQIMAQPFLVVCKFD